MPADAAPTPEFSIGQARGIVKDLFDPRPAVYWTDFLLSMTVGVIAFTAIRRGHLTNFICEGLAIESLAFRWSLISGFFAVSVVCFYRAALFTHELVHLRDGAVKGFRVVWNLMCGIPFLMPSFVYHTHVDHHVRKHYGTDADGEYLPLATGRPWHILWYLAQSFIIPILAVVRFLVLTPLTWTSPRIRDLVHQRASSMIIDPSYVRPLPTRRQLRYWRLQELGVFAYGVTIATLLTLGRMPLMWLMHVYLTGVAIIMLNAIRTLGAHRYRCTGGEVSFMEQLLDSLNYPRWPLVSELWAPVGLRFHALHHLFPSMPYHSLAEAHRRLMRELPADSPYRETECQGLMLALRQLWLDASDSSRAAPATADHGEPPVDRDLAPRDEQREEMSV